MKLFYNNKEIEIKECNSFSSRLLGFMGKKDIKTSLLFNHCNSIHTFFMKENIDVLFLNNKNEIIYFYQNLPKNKIILPKKNVTKVIELPSNFSNYKEKEIIIIK